MLRGKYTKSRGKRWDGAKYAAKRKSCSFCANKGEMIDYNGKLYTVGAVTDPNQRNSVGTLTLTPATTGGQPIVIKASGGDHPTVGERVADNLGDVATRSGIDVGDKNISNTEQNLATILGGPLGFIGGRFISRMRNILY